MLGRRMTLVPSSSRSASRDRATNRKPMQRTGRAGATRGGPARAVLRRGLLLSLVLAAAATTARGQDPAPWLEMTIVHVAPDRVDEFLAAQREISALEKEAGTEWRSVARTAVFGDTYRFVITSPLANFARLDRAGDEDGARATIVSRIRNVITSRTTYALRTAPTLDNPLPDGEAPTLMIVQVVSVAPGREQEYLRVMAEDVLPHFDEAEMHHTTGALTFGGEGGYVHVFHVDNFAALDQGSPMARALGAPAALEVLAKLSGVVLRSEQWLVRYLPDLSFQPEAETEDQP